MPDFTPSTPAVTAKSIADVFANHPLVIVHFWAAWNSVDPVMDARLNEVRKLLPAATHIASCNIDDPTCADLAKSVGVANIPWLSVFVNGHHRGHICGLRDSDELASTLTAIIESPETE